METYEVELDQPRPTGSRRRFLPFVAFSFSGKMLTRSSSASERPSPTTSAASHCLST
jgi:hypothetical protein